MFQERIAAFWSRVHRSLFPGLEEALESPLTEQHRRVVSILDLVRVEEFVESPTLRRRLGRKPKDRRALARGFLVKACLNLAETKDLIDRLKVDRVLRGLCGWETMGALPSESTFSRAFRELAAAHLLDRVHAVRVKDHLGDSVTEHVSRDSTPIEARERAAKVEKAAKPPAPKRKRGRPKKGEVRPAPEPTRLKRQRTQTAEEAIGELPRVCDMGCHQDSQGRVEYWKGYKLHVDVTDEGIPTAALTTSASMHDSQAAIPLMRLTSERIPYCYELMDSAYDAKEIREMSVDLGHMAIIDPNPRRGPRMEWEPDRKRRFRSRSGSERFNARLKDNTGGRMVRVRGHHKVHAYLMCGVLVIFAEAVLGLLT